MVSGKIGIFDSGFGGLTVLKGIRELLPYYDYIYFGDTARAPYGSRSPKTIHRFTKEAVEFLFEQGAELVIIACNTASSEALRKIQQELLPKRYPQKNVLGVIVPTVEEVANETKKVGIMGTEGTIRSGTYIVEIQKMNPTIVIEQVSCPLLVPLIETCRIKPEILRPILEEYLSQFSDIDSLILGCTHYGIIEKEIQEFFGRPVRIFNQEKIIPKKLETYFKNHQDLENKIGKNGELLIYTSDLTKKFELFAKSMLGSKFKLQKIEVY